MQQLCKPTGAGLCPSERPVARQLLKKLQERNVPSETHPALLFIQRPQLGLGQAGLLIGGVSLAGPSNRLAWPLGRVTVWPTSPMSASLTAPLGGCPNVTSDCLREGVLVTHKHPIAEPRGSSLRGSPR